MPQAGTLEATRLINQDALVLDVREDSEFNAGHIPNSRHIPLAQLGDRIKEIEKFKSKPILINCLSGHRSNARLRHSQETGF